MIKRTPLLTLGLCAAVLAVIPMSFLLYGWVEYKILEKSIVEKMDQYYLDISQPGRERYLLESDQMFDVPYMASRLSVQAIPTRIYDINGKLIGEYISEKGLYVRNSSDLPDFLKKALVATEDGTFYKHHGINWRATARAMLVNLKTLHVRQGGSTLTQQLAKVLFTTRRRTYARKVFELFCARKLEEKFTKDQIMLMYLNFAYFGHGCFGVESAAQYYFHKTTAELTLPEASLLVGIINNPTIYSPFNNQELARNRHRTVLQRMAKLGFIPASGVERYWRDFWDTMSQRVKNPEISFWRMRVNEAPYFIEEVRRALEKDYSKERIIKGGLRVYTTLDLELQKDAEESLKEGLTLENKLSAERSPNEKSKVEGAMAAVRSGDGAVLALVGGSGFNFSNQLNRAINIHRPIGSSVKPFVYAVALASGKFTPDDKFQDSPEKYRVGPGRYWIPKNYGDRYYGEVTLRVALQKSLNTVAVKLLNQISIREVVSLFAKASGVDPHTVPHDLSLALGTAEASPLQMAAAFSIFPNNGVASFPYFIQRIEDRDGRVLQETIISTGTAAQQPILDPKVCKTMIDIMRGVFSEGGTAFHAAQQTAFNLPAAGKTGTTNNYRDAWFTGFTPDLSVSVWVGHDDMRVPVGQDRTGGSVAGVIWMKFMKDAYRNRPTRDFDTPGASPWNRLMGIFRQFTGQASN